MKFSWKLKQRKGKKRHGVGKRRSHHARRKHRLLVLARDARARERKRFLAVSRLYWSGAVADWTSAEREADGAPRTMGWLRAAA